MSRYRSAVSGNVAGVKYPLQSHDFPLYVDPGVHLRQELKYLDMPTGDRLTASDGSVIFLDLPTAGDGLSFRLSDRIMVTRIQIRGYVQGPERIAGLGYPTCFMDMVLIWDRQPNGIIPAANNLFTGASLITGTGLYLLPELRDRMFVLFRQRYALTCTQRASITSGQNYTAGNDLQRIIVDEDLPVNRTTSFSFTGGASISEIRQGALYLCFVSTVPPAAADLLPGSRNQIRILFADL